MIERTEQSFILLKMGTAAQKQQPTVFSSSALLFDYPFCPPPLLFLSTSSHLCAFLQLFGFNTRGSKAQRAMCMHLWFYNQEHMHALMLAHAYSEA